MIRRPPRSTLFPYNDALPISLNLEEDNIGAVIFGDYLVLREGDERSEEHTSELQSRLHLVCRLLLEKKTNSRIQRNQTSRALQYTLHTNTVFHVSVARSSRST